MNLDDIKKEAIEDLNAENEATMKQRIKDIVRDISSKQATITRFNTEIAELKQELRNIEVSGEISKESIL